MHTGLDFQADQGTSILAAAGGVVVVQEFHSAYGNMIEIDHGNDLVTRYAHASRTFVRQGDLIKRGQKIAEVGTTGRSTGPHLHFEFRDTKTEKIINPMLFGFHKFLRDTTKPIVSGVYVYPLDSKTSVNQSKRPLLLNMTLQKDGTYLSDKVTANGKIGFGIIANDFDDVSFNKNGNDEVLLDKDKPSY